MTRTPLVWIAVGCIWFGAANPALAQSVPDPAKQPRATVTVLGAGAEPRQELRYRFDQGSSESASVEMTIRLNLSMGGPQQQVVAFPTVRMQVDLGPITVADDGSARYDFAISAAELIERADTNPELAAALSGSLGDLPSVSGWARIDPLGTTLEGDINLADGIDPQLSQVFDSAEQSLQQMSAHLPQQPVGLGARWQVIQDVESAGFRVSQTTNYTLAAVNGNEITLDVALTQTGSDQVVDFPGLPAGIEASLNSLESSGTGSMRVQLNRFVPQSDSVVGIAVALGLAFPGQDQEIGLDIRTETIIAPVN